MSIFNIRSLAAHYVSRGLQPDSLRRQLNRQGISTAGLNMQQIFVDATEEFANQAFLEASSKAYTPEPGVSMISREFSEPWTNRYVARVDFIDPATGEADFTNLSINTNSEYTIGRAESEVGGYAKFLAEEGGGSDIPEGAEITGVEITQAYYNE